MTTRASDIGPSDKGPRVRPPADLEREVAAKLKRDGYFETKASAVLFAAAVGFHHGRREPLTTPGEGIRLEYFGEDVKFIDMVAAADPQNDLGLRILLRENYRQRTEIFEEYAHGGLLLIQERCFKGQMDILEGLMALIENRDEDDSPLPGLL